MPSYKKVPMTAAQKSFRAALDAVKGAIYARRDPDTVVALLDVTLTCHAEYIHEDPPYFSYYHLTERYGVSRKTVETWDLPQHKFGRTIRFKREDVIEWEREHDDSAKPFRLLSDVAEGKTPKRGPNDHD